MDLSESMGVNEAQIDGLTVQVEQGNITLEKTDAIVNSVDKGLTLANPLSQAIVRIGGPSIEAECKASLGPSISIFTPFVFILLTF